MPYLEFISDEDLIKHFKFTLLQYRDTIKSINLKKFNKNIIDPIKLTFDSKVYEKSIEQIIIEELARQRDKTNNNAIGYFHQNIFAYYKNCIVPKHGFDIVFTKSDGSKIYVELKNKHNTMNSSSSQKTYAKLATQAAKEASCECFLVEVIAKHSQNFEWKLTLDGDKVHNERIRRVSIDKFYEIVTGDAQAFYKLCNKIPQIIDDILKTTDKFTVEQDTVFNELKEIDADILKAFYKVAFATYEGF